MFSFLVQFLVLVFQVFLCVFRFEALFIIFFNLLCFCIFENPTTCHDLQYLQLGRWNVKTMTTAWWADLNDEPKRSMPVDKVFLARIGIVLTLASLIVTGIFCINPITVFSKLIFSWYVAQCRPLLRSFAITNPTLSLFRWDAKWNMQSFHSILGADVVWE